MYISNARDYALNDELFFLDGKLVGLDLKDSCFFVLHYETLKEEHFELISVSFGSKTKFWEIKQSAFDLPFRYPENDSPQLYSISKVKIIL